MNASLSELIAAIEDVSSVMIVSHDRPDGDAIGSALAMGRILEGQGKTVEVVNFDPVPDALIFLPCSGRITAPHGKSEAELLIVLDSAGVDRIDASVWEMASAIPKVINIDHHISNTRFGDLCYVDEKAPATGQLVYQLAQLAGWAVDTESAENLLAAISTDTGSFRYPSTSAETMRIAGDLLALGVDVGRLNQNLYENYPLRRVEALRELLQDLRLECGGRCVSVKLPLAVSEKLALRPGDTEGVIDVIRAIDSVKIAIFFEELPDGKVRVSSRSKDARYSVGELCARFGGGGHTLAAGARLPGPLDEAVERFLAAAASLLDEN